MAIIPIAPAGPAEEDSSSGCLKALSRCRLLYPEAVIAASIGNAIRHTSPSPSSRGQADGHGLITRASQAGRALIVACPITTDQQRAKKHSGWRQAMFARLVRIRIGPPTILVSLRDATGTDAQSELPQFNSCALISGSSKIAIMSSLHPACTITRHPL